MKYELTQEIKSFNGLKLRRIKALKDFNGIKAGTLGGWIKKEQNLSQFGSAWVYDNAKVSGSAWVFGNAKVSGSAEVFW